MTVCIPIITWILEATFCCTFWGFRPNTVRKGPGEGSVYFQQLLSTLWELSSPYPGHQWCSIITVVTQSLASDWASPIEEQWSALDAKASHFLIRCAGVEFNATLVGVWCPNALPDPDHRGRGILIHPWSRPWAWGNTHVPYPRTRRGHVWRKD